MHWVLFLFFCIVFRSDLSFSLYIVHILVFRAGEAWQWPGLPGSLSLSLYIVNFVFLISRFCFVNKLFFAPFLCCVFALYIFRAL